MERVGGVRAAIAAYTTFPERWPGNDAAGIGLGNRHYALRELEQAQHADSVPLLNNLAQTLSDLGRDDEDMLPLERATPLDDGTFSAALRETQALVLQRRGKCP